MEYNVALIPGDGIGPEIVGEAKNVLDRYAKIQHEFIIQLCCWAELYPIDANGVPLTNERRSL